MGLKGKTPFNEAPALNKHGGVIVVPFQGKGERDEKLVHWCRLGS